MTAYCLSVSERKTETVKKNCSDVMPRTGAGMRPGATTSAGTKWLMEVMRKRAPTDPL